MFKRWKQRIVLWWWYRQYRKLKADDWYAKFEMLFAQLDNIPELNLVLEPYTLIQSHFSDAGTLNQNLSPLMIQIQNNESIKTFYVDNLKSYFAVEWFEVHDGNIYLTDHFVPPIFRTTKMIISYLKKRPENYSSYIRILEPYLGDVERIALVVIENNFKLVNVKD